MPRPRRPAASLIELLVVLFIMGLMMGLLLPALQGARDRAEQTVCENNVHQLHIALSAYIGAKKRFPAPNRWTIELLPWIEQRPLYDAIKYNKDPNAAFPRPPIMRCPMQDDLPSRVDGAGFCHYLLVVDRADNGDMLLGWDIQDRPLPKEDVTLEPWYIGPEVSYLEQQQLWANPRGPHSDGRYVTISGMKPE
jgi:type II secretory pathway pseudopilin PulG